MPIRIGTRASALALWQARHVLERIAATAPSVELELTPLSSPGDDRPDVSLVNAEEVGLFTSTLERALLEGEIDVAVHCLKDLPTASTTGLLTAAIPARGAVEDVLCAPRWGTLARLPLGARVGTSSPRRVAQLRARRPDLDLIPLRGNVPTRLDRVARGELDAVVLALAGLERLGLRDHATEVFRPDDLLPAAGQGALAIQTRQADLLCRSLVEPLEHLPSRRAVLAERIVLHALRGGCSVPLGTFARWEGEALTLDAAVFDVTGGPAVRVRMTDPDARTLGADVAAWLLAHGADRLLAARSVVEEATR
jgi:hydroxymethylbilane synthase